MTTLHDFTVTDIDGNEQNLGDLKGKVALIINVASRCGYTPQYAALEKLHEELAARGLAVLGFPSNDFGAQEPGTEADIKTFCTTRFGVKFPLFSKVKVTGAANHPVYAWLTSESEPPGAVRWNFEKFLVGKDGKIVARFASGVDPASPELRAAIDRALSALPTASVARPATMSALTRRAERARRWRRPGEYGTTCCAAAPRP